MWDKNVREFFDARAALWDEKMVINEEVIRIILDKAGVEKGKDILDVACGTGVMIPFYLQRDVSSIDGIDISPEMLKIAKEFEGAKVVKGAQPNTTSEPKTDSYGRTMFDFTKKQ